MNHRAQPFQRISATLVACTVLLIVPAAASELRLDQAGGACSAKTLKCGSTLTGALTLDDCSAGNAGRRDLHTFEGKNGQQIRIALTSPDFVPAILLANPFQLVVNFNDLLGAPGTAVTNWTLDMDGTWYIDVYGFPPSGTGTGQGNYELKLTCPVQGKAPSPPDDLTATATGPDRVQLDWKDRSDDEEDFLVEFRSNDGPWNRAGVAPADSTSQMVTGLFAATTYDFRVFSRNGFGRSASNIATATTDSNEPDPEPEPCVASATKLCLNGGRFHVSVSWRDFDNRTGNGMVAPAGSDDSGLFWFFDPDNWEMLIKILDGCAINNHFWVFAAATTNVEYTLTVKDADTGITTDYDNALGNRAPAITDTQAFATCP